MDSVYRITNMVSLIKIRLITLVVMVNHVIPRHLEFFSSFSLFSSSFTVSIVIYLHKNNSEHNNIDWSKFFIYKILFFFHSYYNWHCIFNSNENTAWTVIIVNLVSNAMKLIKLLLILQINSNVALLWLWLIIYILYYTSLLSIA